MDNTASNAREQTLLRSSLSWWSEASIDKDVESCSPSTPIAGVSIAVTMFYITEKSSREKLRATRILHSSSLSLLRRQLDREYLIRPFFLLDFLDVFTELHVSAILFLQAKSLPLSPAQTIIIKDRSCESSKISRKVFLIFSENRKYSSQLRHRSCLAHIHP